MRIRLSYATAQKLSFKGGRSVELRTFYFMIDGKCVFDCAFCTHARNSKSDLKFLSRVVWIEYSLDEVLKAMENLEKLPKRLCFQVVSSPGYYERTLKVVEKFVKFGIPISVNLRPKRIEEIENLIELGVDRIGIAMDAATPEIFERTRDGKWEDLYNILKEAVGKFPKRIVTHLIVGMGETEEEAVEFLRRMKRIGVKVGIFGFTPMKGTRMENHPAVDFDYYRRIKILSLKLDGVDDVVDPILTPTGCPNCDKPFYDVSPLTMLKRRGRMKDDDSFRKF